MSNSTILSNHISNSSISSSPAVHSLTAILSIVLSLNLFLLPCGQAKASDTEDVRKIEENAGNNEDGAKKTGKASRRHNNQQSIPANSCELAVRKVFASKTPTDSLILPQDEDGSTIFNICSDKLSKGTVIDFNATVNPTENCDNLYVLEYLDGKKWFSCDTVMFYRADDNATRQSATIMQTFRLRNTAKHGLLLRLRPVSDSKESSCQTTVSSTSKKDKSTQSVPNASQQDSTPRLSLAKYGYTAEYVQNFGKGTAKDTTDILCIGNSFTYVGATPFFLKEIAWNEGHLLRIHASVKGGQTFGQHLKLPLTDFAIHADRYDYAFLQNQSQAAARYASDSTKHEQIAEDVLTLVGRVLENSPECRIVLESTWAFPSGNYGGFGSYESFDSLMESGTSMLKAKASEAYPETDFIQSPIGKTFACARHDSDIDLYDSDKKHQSIYGAYLKACVNYLMLFGNDGEGFSTDSSTGGTSIDCGLNHEIAAALRAIAAKIVTPYLHCSAENN